MSKFRAFVGPAAAIALSMPAVAETTITIFQTGFEASEGYAGGALNGQNGWSPFLGISPNMAQVVDTSALGGSQAVRLDSQSLDVIDDPAGALRGGSIGRALSVPATQDALALASISLGAKFQIQAAGPIEPMLGTNVILWGGSGGDVFVEGAGPGIESNLPIFGYATPPAFNNATPIQLGTTYSFQVDLDYATGVSTLHFDGVLLDSRPFDTSTLPSLLDMQLVNLDTSLVDANVFYDDLSVTASYIPAPGAAALLGLVGLTASRRRR
ncbi:MAG: hypothetical protein SFZ23_08795 [Planctomycetota bacterium]|nr:hypothetical protein [Planctomycetota bacterium]